MKDALKRVPGVGDVMIFGERKYAMRVWLDPVRMAARGLTATDVVNALQEQNVEIPAGQLGQPPANSKQAFQIPVRVVGRLTSPAEFDNIIVKNSANGLVLLKDVGHSAVGAEDYSMRAGILTGMRPWASAWSNCPTPTRSKWTGSQGRARRACRRAFRRAWNTPLPSTRQPWSATRSAKC